MLRRSLLAIALTFSLAAPALAAPTEIDQKYTEAISSEFIAFQEVIGTWSSIASEQPTKTTSPKYKSWALKFTKSSNDVLEAITKLDSIVAPETFSKSDPLLHKCMGNYKKGITQLKKAVDSNNTKAIAAATKILNTANKGLSTWQKSYVAEVNALNA